MSRIRFEIRHPTGHREVVSIDAERALIGSGAHCDVRLPVDQAAPEAVAVDVLAGTVRIETKAFNPPAVVNGMPFTQIPITPEVPLRIGATHLFIALEGDDVGGVKGAQKKGEGVSPLAKGLALVGLAGALYLLLSEDDKPLPSAPAQAPDLFLAAPGACPQLAPDQALSFGTEKFDIAEGKRERSPFAPREGVQAVQLYETARACFQRAGDSAHASEADANAHQLREAIVHDFRARRLRLEHLMAVGDYELARGDVTVLRALTDGKQGPWVAWLASAHQTVKQWSPKP